MIKRLVFIFTVLFFFTACEKVIQVPLNEADQKVVIEANLKDRANVSFIRLTKSGTVYDNGGFETLTDALVELTDNEGTIYTFTHDTLGFYRAEGFQVVPGRRYDLRVMAEGEEITATHQPRLKPTIDSVTYAKATGIFGSPSGEDRFLVSFHSVDNAAEQNNYLLYIYRNGDRNSGYYLGNDDFINGQYYNASFFGANAKPGDTVIVEMLSMDKPTYEYYIGLSSNIDQSPFAAAPANPPSNISSNALGLFGVYATDTVRVVIPI